MGSSCRESEWLILNAPGSGGTGHEAGDQAVHLVGRGGLLTVQASVPGERPVELPALLQPRNGARSPARAVGFGPRLARQFPARFARPATGTRDEDPALRIRGVGGRDALEAA